MPTFHLKNLTINVESRGGSSSCPTPTVCITPTYPVEKAQYDEAIDLLEQALAALRNAEVED